eukprot:COSAG01_NODE_70047_length_259_cov_1.931250_1_plen_47_part_01
MTAGNDPKQSASSPLPEANQVSPPCAGASTQKKQLPRGCGERKLSSQ